MLTGFSQREPEIVVRPPGPQTRTWLTRATLASAPMGPRRTAEITPGVQANVPPGSIVYATASGSNVVDVDGNRYVDLAAGFGAVLLGHAHPHVTRVLELQAARLLQALGDVYPADAKIALVERLSQLHLHGSGSRGQVILGLSGADAVSAALKSAVLYTGKAGVIAFRGSYHGLSYGPLAVSGLRESYRAPFTAQLNPHVSFLEYPVSVEDAERVLSAAHSELASGSIGALIVEPILGRGGCLVPPAGFLRELAALARARGALVIADEIWTGLGRSGELLCSSAWRPDLICLGKGLGGGLPISACIGSEQVMAAWSQEAEVVHTSTFAGAPLACATAIATLDTIAREQLVSRAEHVGSELRAALERAVTGLPVPCTVTGRGLMLAVHVGAIRGGAARVQRALLERGYIVSTGGGGREAVVLTPPLTIAEPLLGGFVQCLGSTLHSLAS